MDAPRTPASPGLWQSTLGRLSMVGLSVCAMVLCCPDYDIWWLGFVAWVPYFAAIEGLRPRAAFLYGWLIGLFTVFWGFFWMTELLVKFADFSTLAASPVALLFAAWHGVIWGSAAAAIAWLRRRTTVALWVTAPLCWVAAEALLPNIFPIYMALGWSWQPLWIQTAELGGVTTVSFIMVAINAGLYTMWVSWLRGGRIDKKATAVTLTLLVAVPLYGAMRISAIESEMTMAPKLRMGVVQGNFSIKEMAQRDLKTRILAGQQRVSAELQAQGAQVVLWGETAYPNGGVFTRQMNEEPPEGNPWRVHQGFDVPVILGAVTRDATGVSPYPWNTALLIDGDGTIVDRYDKVYRLIFGEYVPIVDPKWYLEQIPSASHIEQGAGPRALEFLGYRLGPFICYEDILPRYVRQTANQDVHVFVNLTNDAWFGKTHEPAQHLGLAVFRAIEHRKAMVRAVNTGISAYVDPTGAVAKKTRVVDPDIDGPQEAEGFWADVPMMDPEHRTPYGLTGELFNGLCVLGVVLIALLGPRAPMPADHVLGGTSMPEPEPEPDAESEDSQAPTADEDLPDRPS